VSIDELDAGELQLKGPSVFAGYLADGGANLDDGLTASHFTDGWFGTGDLARMARYKVPLRMIELDEFPTTPSANGTKIRKADLRAMAAALVAPGA